MSQECCWAICVALGVGRGSAGAAVVAVGAGVRAIVGLGVGASVGRDVGAPVGGTDVGCTDVGGTDVGGTAASVGVARSTVVATVGASA